MRTSCLDQQQGIILYDYLLVQGGAERVSLLLAEALDAELCFGFRANKIFADPTLAHLRYHDLKAKTNILPWRYIKVSQAFLNKAHFIDRFPWALFSGSCAPLAVNHRLNKKNLYYCHALPSFAYELEDYYLEQLPAPAKLLLRRLSAWLRPRYEQALNAMTVLLTNSQTTQNLLKQFLGLDSIVIYPPVDTHLFQWLGQADYYLSTARLEPHKQVTKIIEAFRFMPEKKLIIAGWGSVGKSLQKQAADAQNITFTGWVDPPGMQSLISNCIATLYFGKNEPFGISPIESMAAGKPVISIADGGMRETILDRKTGILLEPELTTDAIIDAVRTLNSTWALTMREACDRQAELFSSAVFFKSLQNLIGD